MGLAACDLQQLLDQQEQIQFFQQLHQQVVEEVLDYLVIQVQLEVQVVEEH